MTITTIKGFGTRPPEDSAPTIAAVYCRRSTEGQTDNESLDLQKKMGSDYCAAHKLTPIFYIDDAVSGASPEKQDALKELNADVAAGKIKKVIVSAIDRYGRDTKQFLTNMEHLEKHGVEFISLRENIQADSFTAEMFRTFSAGVATWERKVIQARTHAGRQSKWEKGECYPSKCPYGYERDKVNNCFKIVPDEAEIVRMIFDMYVDAGFSFAPLALKLREMGIKGREGIKSSAKYFSPARIQYMIRNTCYFGKMFTKSYTFDLPPIISKEKWDMAQEKRKFNKAKGKRITKAESYWLRDMLQCGECGGTIKPVHSSPRNDGGYRRYYACYWRKEWEKLVKAYGRTKCQLPFIKADELEEEVETIVLHDLRFDSIMGKDDSIFKLLSPETNIKRKSELEAGCKAIQAEKERKQRGLNNLMELLESIDFNKTDFTDRYKAMVSEIETLEARSSSLSQEIKELEIIIADNTKFIEFIKENREWLEQVQQDLMNLSPADKKRFYESIFAGEKIKVHLGGDGSEGIPPHGTLELPPIRLNASIFQLLSSEGRLTQFHKKSLDKLAGNHFAQRKIQGEVTRQAGGKSKIQIVRDIF